MEGWGVERGVHAVQFYEEESFLHRAAADFVADALRGGHPIVMITHPRTFEGVVRCLASDGAYSQSDLVNRILFIDGDAALAGLMKGSMPDPVLVDESYQNLVAAARMGGRPGTIWIYGDMADRLVRAGNPAAALQLEQLWNTASAGGDTSLMCAYAIDGFDDEAQATHFRGICREHTHVVPTERVTEAPDDRSRLEEVALLQQRVRALDRVRARRAAVAASTHTCAKTVYVIDDDSSVRRSLGRLLASAELRVKTFESAEAFLAEEDRSSCGCLILDIQLGGMHGLDLQRRMTELGWPMPIIAMSGSHDPGIEADALELGARVFLRKPFHAQALLDAVTLALGAHG